MHTGFVVQQVDPIGTSTDIGITCGNENVNEKSFDLSACCTISYKYNKILPLHYFQTQII